MTNSVDHYIQQGMMQYQEKKFKQALENFETAQKLQPGNEQVNQLVTFMKHAVEMEDASRKAAEEEANQRAQVLGITDVEKAIYDFSEELRRNPNDTTVKNNLASAYYIRGTLYVSKNEHAKAVSDYDEAIKYLPDYPHALNKRAMSCLVIGNFDQAIADYKTMRQSDPNNDQLKTKLANAYGARGMDYDKKGDYGKAIDDFDEVLKLEPNNSTIRELREMAKARIEI
jgi:tetratricopeptide (TPR) repeat protein